MTNITPHSALHGAAVRFTSKRQVARKAAEVTLALALIAALAGAWLAFFTFVPLDFSPPRPG